MGYREPTFSTSIQLNRSRIHFRIENRWIEFSVGAIQVIGEFTAPPGTLSSDYFFSFKLRDIPQTVDVPAYTEGLLDEVLPGLRKLLPGVGKPLLQMRNGFASNVLYPAHVAGMNMFDFSTRKRAFINLPLIRNIARYEQVEKGINQEVMDLIF